jgi:hypothetical protein
MGLNNGNANELQKVVLNLSEVPGVLEQPISHLTASNSMSKIYSPQATNCTPLVQSKTQTPDGMMRKPLKLNYVKFQINTDQPTLPDLVQIQEKDKRGSKSREPTNKAKFPDVFSHASHATEHAEEYKSV